MEKYRSGFLGSDFGLCWASVPVVFGLSVLLAAPLAAHAEKVRVSVTRFENKAAIGASDGEGCHGWYWFASDLGTAFQERLIATLVSAGKFQVLERETIREIYENEHALVNSERVKKLKKGQFQVADFTFVGAATEFEWCSGAQGGGINLGQLVGIGDVGISARSSSAKVGVELRVINTTTGEVLGSSSGTAETSSTHFGLEGMIKSVDFRAQRFRNSPLSEAIDEAVRKAAAEVVGVLDKYI